MTSALTNTRAYAIELRCIGTGKLHGVALLVPSDRHLSILFDDAEKFAESKPKAQVWQEIETWVAAGNAGLPTRPLALTPAMVATLLEQDSPAISGQRFASIPISVTSRTELVPLAESLLPALLNARRSVA